MTIKLRLEIKHEKPSAYQFGKQYKWQSSLPFFDNCRAILIHRPRFVTTYHNFKDPHLGITAFCGNSFVGGNNFQFMSAPIEGGKMVCARCELAAVEAGLPTSDELAGFHVHLGKLKAVKLCCKDKEQ